MKKKLKIFFISIISISIFCLFGFIIYICVKSSKTDIYEKNKIEEKEKKEEKEKNKSSKIVNKDFVNNNLNIKFNLEQKIYLINYSKNSCFNLSEFKYYFLIEFNKLGPKKNFFELSYQVDSYEIPKIINVCYQGINKNYFWFFKIK